MCLWSVLTSLPLGVSSSSGLFLLTNFSLDISFSWPLYLDNWQLFPLPFSNNSSSCRLSLDAIHSFQNQISMSQQEKIERVRFLSIKKIYAENRTRQNWRKHRQTAALCNNSIEKVTFRPQFDCAQLLFPFPFSLFSFLFSLLHSPLLSSPLLFSSLLFSPLLCSALLFSTLLYSFSAFLRSPWCWSFSAKHPLEKLAQTSPNIGPGGAASWERSWASGKAASTAGLCFCVYVFACVVQIPYHR